MPLGLDAIVSFLLQVQSASSTEKYCLKLTRKKDVCPCSHAVYRIPTTHVHGRLSICITSYGLVVYLLFHRVYLVFRLFIVLTLCVPQRRRLGCLCADAVAEIKLSAGRGARGAWRKETESLKIDDKEARSLSRVFFCLFLGVLLVSMS